MSHLRLLVNHPLSKANELPVSTVISHSSKHSNKNVYKLFYKNIYKTSIKTNLIGKLNSFSN